MGDGDFWRKLKKERKRKRWENFRKSINLLKKKGIEFDILDKTNGHVRVGAYSFWPTTGKFYNPDTKDKGRGVFNLIKKIKNEK